MSDEMLAVYDETMTLKGLKKRSTVHMDGDLHQVVHCWGYEKTESGVWFYFQQRSFSKKDYPGLYDLLATGHIDGYEDITAAVIRETAEEAGVIVDKRRLKYMGRVRQTTFNEKIRDNEMTNVFLYEIKDSRFNINEELERMVKIRVDDYKDFMSNGRDFVRAYTLDGEEFKIGKDEWCDKRGEYRAFIEENDMW